MTTLDITLDHIDAGCRAAIASRDGTPIDGHGYDQREWCGIACCIWGHAVLAAGLPLDNADGGPSSIWPHRGIASMLTCITTTPEQVLLRSPIWGNVSGLRGDVTGLFGDVSGLRGDVTDLRGDVSGLLRGDVSRLTGDVSRLTGDVSRLTGDVSRLTGDVSRLTGDVSGLRGDMTGLTGDVSGLTGDVSDIAAKIS